MDRLSEDYVIENGRVCHRIEPFCGDEEQLKQIVRAELAAPLERMLLTLSEIRAVRASFGKATLNERVVVERLEKDAAEIETACKAMWRDL